ncbi:MAG TPA: 30S ribosomal protein S12 methylthiotransferase RimO, partial [Candidatus Dormibacteraeota bacterium]|nr:30S ribosomal protein S12 methylthiotransferase RimO [Candidatus Dormibacteraeota bacterium]
MPTRRSYVLHTLGCSKNEVDASYIEGLMDGAGYEVAASPEEADVAIVHTCGFIEPAAQESVDTLLGLARVKETNPGLTLVASGCLAQRHGLDLAEAMPELDVVVGTRDWPQLPGVIDDARVSSRR